MKHGIFAVGLAMLVQTVCFAFSEIPPLLTCSDGTQVTTKEQWENKRRPELLELFRSQVYGRNLVERPDTLAFESE